MAPTIAATNEITQGINLLIESIARLSSFQTWTKTADVTGAKTHIYFQQWEDIGGNDEYMARLPVAIIEPPEGESLFSASHYSTDNPFKYLPQWELSVVLVDRRYELTTPEDAVFKLYNDAGLVMLDLAKQSGSQSQENFRVTDILLGDYVFRKESHDDQLPSHGLMFTVQNKTEIS